MSSKVDVPHLLDSIRSTLRRCSAQFNTVGYSEFEVECNRAVDSISAVIAKLEDSAKSGTYLDPNNEWKLFTDIIVNGNETDGDLEQLFDTVEDGDLVEVYRRRESAATGAVNPQSSWADHSTDGYNGLDCSVCGSRQFTTPSGTTCGSGHGGAPGVEIVNNKAVGL